MQLANHKTGNWDEEDGREGGKGRGGGGKEEEMRLDAVKRLAVACIAVTLRRTALLSGRSCSHVCARERLQLMQLLRQLPQHASAEVGAALGKGPVHAAGEGTHKRHAQNRLIGLGNHADG